MIQRLSSHLLSNVIWSVYIKLEKVCKNVHELFKDFHHSTCYAKAGAATLFTKHLISTNTVISLCRR
jgi:hypothetical protein